MKREVKSYDAFSQGEARGNVWKVRAAKNVEFLDGEARTGVGVAELRSLSGEKLKLYDVPSVDSVFTVQTQENGGVKRTHALLTVQGDFYEWDEQAKRFEPMRIFGGRMKAVPVTSAVEEGEAQCVMLVGSGGVYMLGERQMTVASVSKVLPTGCFALGRFFFVKSPFTLSYSTPYVPLDNADSIEDGGNVRLPTAYGPITGIAAMDEFVYIFYEYGISRMKVSGSARTFRVEPLHYAGGKIHGDTLGVCAATEKKILFLAEDGLYALQNECAKKVCKELDITPLRGEYNCGVAVFDGKYFVSYLDIDGTRKAVVADAETGKGYFAFAAVGLSLFAGRAYCQSGGLIQGLTACGGDLPDGETHTFETEDICFGKQRKTLDAITLLGEGNCSVCIRCEQGEWHGRLSLTQGVDRQMPRLRGKRFSFAFTLDKGSRLRGVQAEFQSLGGERTW